MTRDHRRKKAVRAHAAETGRTYADAAASLRGSGSGTAPPPVLATRLRDELVAALAAAGWPVEVEHTPQFGALRVYAGPATLEVSRTAEPARSASGDEHPDDPKVFDLDAPLWVTVWAPLIVDYSEELQRVVGVDAHEIAGDRPVADIVAEIDQVITQARRRDVADAAATAECGICGDRYPAEGLFQPTASRVEVCPCCPFDGDLLGPHPARLAFHLDLAASQNLALPAGWSAAQALLCCLGGPDLPTWLHAQWRAAGTSYDPSEGWEDPARTWVWLPPAAQRPAALAGLGCGASLGHIIAAIDQAHPDLRATCRALQELDEDGADQYGADLDDDLEDDLEEGGAEPDPERSALRVPDATFERIWPAAVAYTVAMLTQHAERPTHRGPWHVVQSFELPDWVDALDPGLDHYHVETVLHVGIETIRDTLDPRGHGPSEPAAVRAASG